MSLNIGTLVESHLSMICPQTTHLAILLSLLESREYVTAYRAPQWGQKKLRPSGIAPVRGIGTPPNSRLSCSLKQIPEGGTVVPPSSRIDRHACFIVKNIRVGLCLLPGRRSAANLYDQGRSPSHRHQHRQAAAADEAAVSNEKGRPKPLSRASRRQCPTAASCRPGRSRATAR